MFFLFPAQFDFGIAGLDQTENRAGCGVLRLGSDPLVTMSLQNISLLRQDKLLQKQIESFMKNELVRNPLRFARQKVMLGDLTQSLLSALSHTG